MGRYRLHATLALAGLLLAMQALAGQPRQNQGPGIGYVYPAGGQQGATFQVTLGGQSLDGVSEAFVSGSGVKVKVLEFNWIPNSQENLLRELRDELREKKDKSLETKHVLAAINKRMGSVVRNPASVAIGQQVTVQVTISSAALTGAREIRLATPRGLTNPLDFHVGYLPEYSAPSAITSPKQILGREEESLRTRKLHDEVKIKQPCVVNGQISSGAIDRYRFEARRGQRLVISVLAQQLVPYIADAVPGWFQAVLALYDSKGKQVAFDDDYKFKPDPVIFYEVPQDGEYTFAIYDSIYRGREDFVYRITVGELPFVTSTFPLGGPAGSKTEVALKGWNLPVSKLELDDTNKAPGVYPIQTRVNNRISNSVLFAVDTLPECLEREPNNTPAEAQQVKLPIIINGCINQPGDWDVFQFEGHSGEAIVAEVHARRLDSPLDSVLKLTDLAGTQLAFNDDHEDKSEGLNTHDADSYLTATLPADGLYYLHLGDTEHKGGEDYCYRLRISAPQPDFALRVVPASVGFVNRQPVPLSVFVFRRDGFAEDIRLELKDPPKGFSLKPAVLGVKDESVQLFLTASEQTATKEPVALTIIGRAKVKGKELVREVVAAEDRMQAFAYHHLVPAQELMAHVSIPPPPPAVPKKPPVAQAKSVAAQPSGSSATGTPASKTSPGSSPNPPPKKLSRDQAFRLLKDLNELWAKALLTKDFYNRKIKEVADAGLEAKSK